MSDDPRDQTIPLPKPKRVRGKGKKKRAPRKARPERADAASLPDKYVAVASFGDAGQSELDKLRADNARLNAQLDTERTMRTAAEASALAMAEAQSFLMQREIQEVPTGKTVKVKRSAGLEVKGYKDDGRDILRPIWKEVELPTYFYKIDLPPSGGMDFKINGDAYYHGATYEFDADTLRSVKEIVYRCWAHDTSIHGSDENVYRRLDPAYQARNAGIHQIRR